MDTDGPFQVLIMYFQGEGKESKMIINVLRFLKQEGVNVEDCLCFFCPHG